MENKNYFNKNQYKEHKLFLKRKQNIQVYLILFIAFICFITLILALLYLCSEFFN